MVWPIIVVDIISFWCAQAALQLFKSSNQWRTTLICDADVVCLLSLTVGTRCSFRETFASCWTLMAKCAGAWCRTPDRLLPSRPSQYQRISYGPRRLPERITNGSC